MSELLVGGSEAGGQVTGLEITRSAEARQDSDVLPPNLSPVALLHEGQP
jgi:hypothetical protein